MQREDHAPAGLSEAAALLQAAVHYFHPGKKQPVLTGRAEGRLTVLHGGSLLPAAKLPWLDAAETGDVLERDEFGDEEGI